jgi:hypothetical protein
MLVPKPWPCTNRSGKLNWFASIYDLPYQSLTLAIPGYSHEFSHLMMVRDSSNITFSTGSFGITGLTVFSTKAAAGAVFRIDPLILGTSGVSFFTAVLLVDRMVKEQEKNKSKPVEPVPVLFGNLAYEIAK